MNAATNEGMTPLIAASMNAQVAVMRVLLEGEADPNAASSEGETTLLRLLKYQGGTQAYRKHQEEGAALLLAFGAEPNTRNRQGETALQRAKQHSLATIVQRLLHEGTQSP